MPIQEIDSIGVQVKDLDKGLLDFPCQVGEQIVLLCWQLGEAKIDYWHTVEAGFQGRQSPWTNVFKKPGQKDQTSAAVTGSAAEKL